jgi:ABC-type dipeptide/oligopeptide/nickel transport system permease subunit
MHPLLSIFTKIANAASSADAMVNEIMPRIIDNIVMPIVQFIFALATIYFIYGLFVFFTGSADATKRKQGQDHILWGVIGIFIMISVYGIIRFVASSVGQPSPL